MGEAKEELCKMIDALPAKKIKVLKIFLENLLKTNYIEDQGWLEANMGILPSYEWRPEGLPKGQPIICELRADELKPGKKYLDLSKFKGIAKGVWGVDAQKYIEEIRDEDRD
ncbi:hypothetical protein [Candidatus Contubernalis alkaliaceticus]|uniref:hypothetical protein n=1 Tax=Candidatus Contubernalis alkaliaceticus TaxID=338645 RepID=UPI001F4C0584|nr:hypothetical protein [Candidatus Contubernalis alkalaceticus]UNC93573.1 hypothetical protein HUE98_16715 [Candidatus Contubernalis alkalaceticus]